MSLENGFPYMRGIVLLLRLIKLQINNWPMTGDLVWVTKYHDVGFMQMTDIRVLPDLPEVEEN